MRIAISERMNQTPSMLNYYQSVDSYVKEVIGEERRQRFKSQFQAREEELECLVLEAMQQLLQSGQDVTTNAIARIVHLSPNHFLLCSELAWNLVSFRGYDGIVIIPMVLQIGETMVLQRVELEEKVSSSHFWIFGS